MAWEREQAEEWKHQFFDAVVLIAKPYGLEVDFIEWYKRYRRADHDIYMAIVCAAIEWDILPYEEEYLGANNGYAFKKVQERMYLAATLYDPPCFHNS